jgi:hypothetical protein
VEENLYSNIGRKMMRMNEDMMKQWAKATESQLSGIMTKMVNNLRNH